jgi:predicted sugar kinase
MGGFLVDGGLNSGIQDGEYPLVFTHRVGDERIG